MNKEQRESIDKVFGKLQIVIQNARSFIEVAKFINYPKVDYLNPKQNSELFLFMEQSELFHKMQIFGWRLFVIEICKIYDNNATVSLEGIKKKLISYGVDISGTLFDQLQQQLENDKEILTRAKKLRDKYYAHTEKEVHPGKELLFNWSDAESLIITCENLLNYYLSLFNIEKVEVVSSSIYETNAFWKEEIISLSGVIKN